MSLALSPATEARIQAELATGRYAAPSELLDHALDLVDAERAEVDLRRTAFIARLEESIAQADRGEGVSGQELRARFKARKAAWDRSQAVAS